MTGLRHRGRRRAVADFVAASSGSVGVERLDDRCSLASYYAEPVRFDRTIPWHEASHLVLDVESTAVDPNEGHLLSMGWVCVDGGAIVAASARHHLIRPPMSAEVGQSAVVHHITDTEAETGEEPEVVVEALLADLTGRILVCHFAQIELGYLAKVCRHRWGIGFWPWQLIDTMQWHIDRSRRMLQVESPRNVRLYGLLDQYGLPTVGNHHALSDAYGTALLLMALGGGSAPTGLLDAGTAPGVRTLGDLLDRRSWAP